jgi:hypothetical protein
VKFPGPNQPAFEANSTMGSAIAAAMTAIARHSPNRLDEIVKDAPFRCTTRLPFRARSAAAQDSNGS